MKIIKKYLDKNQYYTREYKKEFIFVHFTAGTTAEGAISWWNQTKSHVGTAFVIDDDEEGTIYETFDPKQYAYHLGIRGTSYLDKHSIGIEVVSPGPLHKEGGKFMFYPLWPSKNAGKEIPKDRVFEVEDGWRGHRYFHKISNAQCKALKELIIKLVKEFDIPLQESSENWNRYNNNVINDKIPGIWAHTTVRQDKLDMPPQIAVMNVIREVFQEFKPKKKKTRRRRTSH